VDEHQFPAFIRALPQVDSPLASFDGWMLQNDRAMATFYRIPDGVDLPEHAHGAQWGVVLEGQIDFTIAGETRSYRRGDTYYVPDGAPHSAVIHPDFVGIDVFADADRYRAREEVGQLPREGPRCCSTRTST
jgi:quercetin dioxygenase-like cupin family protein